MLKSISIMIVLGCLLSSCATFKNADPWTDEQVVLQSVAAVLKVADWGTTLDIENCANYYETNPILGKHPNRGKINKYFALSLGSQVFITHILPSKYRNWWLGTNILISGYMVKNNFGIGLKLDF